MPTTYRLPVHRGTAPHLPPAVATVTTTHDLPVDPDAYAVALDLPAVRALSAQLDDLQAHYRVRLQGEHVVLVDYWAPAETAELVPATTLDDGVVVWDFGTLGLPWETDDDEGDAEDDSRECAACGDEVGHLSSRDRCDACELDDDEAGADHA